MIERNVLVFLGQLHDAAGAGQIRDGELCVLASTIILSGGGVRVLLRAGLQTVSGAWICLNGWLGDTPLALCAEMVERADELTRLAYFEQRLHIAAAALGLTLRRALPEPLLNPLKT